MSHLIKSILPLRRSWTLALGVVVGACAGGVTTTVATQWARPSIPPQAPTSTASVTQLREAATWEVGGGKASVKALAHGKNAWLGQLKLSPNGRVPQHRDATEEYIHVLAGGGDITIDGVTRRIGKGDTVYMPAGAQVSYANGAAELVALQVFAGPSPAAKYTRWTKVTP